MHKTPLSISAWRGFVGVCIVDEGFDYIRCSVICRPGGDLLFRVLGRSTIGAGAIYGRVRDGIGYGRPAVATRPANDRGYIEHILFGANGVCPKRGRCLSWIFVFVMDNDNESDQAD